MPPLRGLDWEKMPSPRRQAFSTGASYTSDSDKPGARALSMRSKVNDKLKPRKDMSASRKKRNRQHSSIRAQVEHCFRVVKYQCGYQQISYKGLEKNRVQIFSLLSLTNWYL
jgi:transposase, IS5 family